VLPPGGVPIRVVPFHRMLLLIIQLKWFYSMQEQSSFGSTVLKRHHHWHQNNRRCKLASSINLIAMRDFNCFLVNKLMEGLVGNLISA